MKKNYFISITILFFASFVFGSTLLAQEQEEIQMEEISVPIIDEQSIPTNENSPITIESNCEQTIWCNEQTVIFTWDVDDDFLGDVREYTWSLDTQNPNTKQLKSIGLEESVFFEKLENGVYYLYVQAMLDDKSLLDIQVYRVKIDTLAPELFEPVVKDSVIEIGQKTQISFQTKDIHSGIDHYEVSVDNGSWEDEKSPLIIEGGDIGVYYIKIKAVDKSQNETITEGFVEVVKKLPFLSGDSKKSILGISSVSSTSVMQKIFIPVIIVIFGVIILGLILFVKNKRSKQSL